MDRPSTAANSEVEDRVLRLERIVEQQQQRILLLEALVERQNEHTAQLESRLLGQHQTTMAATEVRTGAESTSTSAPVAAKCGLGTSSRRPHCGMADGIEVAMTAENALSDSMKQLTSQLERKLRASDAAFDVPSGCGVAAVRSATTRRLSDPPAIENVSAAAAVFPASTYAVGAGQESWIPPWVTPPPHCAAGASRNSSRVSSRGSSRGSSRTPTPPPPTGSNGAALLRMGAGRANLPGGVSGAVARPRSTPTGAEGLLVGTPSRQLAGTSHARARSSPQQRQVMESSPGAAMGGVISRSRPTSGGSSRHSSRPSSGGRRGDVLTRIAKLKGPSDTPVTAIVAIEDGSGLVSAGMDGQLQVWTRAEDPQIQGLGTTARSAQTWRRALTQPVGGGEINAMALRGTTLACGCQDGSVRLFRLFQEAGAFVAYSLLRKQHGAENSARNSFGAAAPPAAPPSAAEAPADASPPPSTEVMAVVLAPTSSARQAPLLASGGQDGNVCLWDTANGRLLQRIAAHDGATGGWVMTLVLARHEDNKRGLMITASYDHTAKVWVRTADDATGSAINNISAVGSFSSVSSSGIFGVGGAMPGEHRPWTHELTLEGHTDGILGLELSRTRRHAFSASNDKTIRTWDLRNGACVTVLKGHASSVATLGWHLSSGCLVSGAEDGMVHVWDVRALEELGPSTTSGPVPDCENDDGSTSSKVELGSHIQSINLEHCEVLCMAVSADGTALFCGLDDGTLAVLASAASSSA